MSSDFKLDIATNHDSEERGIGKTIGSNISLDEKGKTVHTSFNGIYEQGKLSPNNYVTNAERRALYDRCETTLFHFFLFIKIIYVSMKLHLWLISMYWCFSFSLLSFLFCYKQVSERK